MRRTVTRLGMKVASTTRIRRTTRRFGSIKGDCVAYTGITANGAVRMFNRVSRKAKLFASDGVAESGFTRRVSASVAKRMTSRSPRSRPTPTARPAPRSSASATRTSSTATRR